MIFPPSWLLHPTVKGAQVHEELGAGQAGDVVRLDTVTEIEARRRVHDRVWKHLRRLAVHGDGEVRAAHDEVSLVPLLHGEIVDGLSFLHQAQVVAVQEHLSGRSLFELKELTHRS